MKLEDIIDLEPQCASIEVGAEPSLRAIVEKYYAPHFPEDYKDLADDYFDKLSKLIKMEVWHKCYLGGRE